MCSFAALLVRPAHQPPGEYALESLRDKQDSTVEDGFGRIAGTQKQSANGKV